LLDLFNSYRPKNRDVPNSVVGTLELLDRQLDRELVDYKKVIAADADGEPEQPVTSPRASPVTNAGDSGRLPAGPTPGNSAEHRAT
jgi:hypothetical protein